MLVITSGANAGVAGELSANVAINLPGVSVSGSLAVELNTTPNPVDDTFQLNGLAATVNVPGGNPSYLELSGTGITVTVGSLSIAGNFTFSEGTAGVVVTLSNASFSLGGGLISVAQGAGTIDFVSGGVYGAFTATLGFNVSAVSATGTFEVELNTTGSMQQVTDPLNSSNTLSIDAKTTSVSGTNVSLSVAGEEIGAGTLIITSGSTSDGTKYVAFAIENLTLQISSGGQTFVNITAADGVSADLFVSSAGVAGQLTATVVANGPNQTFNLPSGMSLGATSLKLSFNTGAAPVDEQFSAGSASATINVPAGPFLNVEVDGATLSFTSANLTISGSFVFAQNTEPSFGSGSAVGTAPSTGTVSSVAVADVNGDGLPDIVVGVNGGASLLFLNSKTSPGTYTAAPAGDFPALTNADTVAVALADVNNDGLPDLIVATGGANGQTQVFLNQGTSDGQWQGFASTPTQTLMTPGATLARARSAVQLRVQRPRRRRERQRWHHRGIPEPGEQQHRHLAEVRRGHPALHPHHECHRGRDRRRQRRQTARPRGRHSGQRLLLSTDAAGLGVGDADARPEHDGDPDHERRHGCSRGRRPQRRRVRGHRRREQGHPPASTS